MAEIFFVTRGHHDHVDKFVRAMRSLTFPMNFKKKVTDEAGQVMEIDSVQNIEGQLRPYQFWGYVCPEKYVQPLCNNLGIPSTQTWFDGKQPDGSSNNSFISGFGVQGYLTALRLAFKAKKFEPVDSTKPTYAIPIYRRHINILGVGWREDETIKTALGKHEGV